MNRIALHTFTYCNTPAIISTVEIFGEYETMVMYKDGKEIESFYADSLENAKVNHNKAVKYYNDKVYNGGISKLLGVKNDGQFVKTIIPC